MVRGFIINHFNHSPVSTYICLQKNYRISAQFARRRSLTRSFHNNMFLCFETQTRP